MYLHVNIPPIPCYVRPEYLYDFEKGKAELTEAVAFSVKSIKGHALFFQVMTDIGAVYDKIPISGICLEKDAPHMSFDTLQLWDCASYHFTCVEFEFLVNKKCQVFLKDRNKYFGEYLFTLDWAADQLGGDTSFAQVWPEHKSAHIIALENGCIAAQPNNRLLWADPSWIHKPFETIPDYKVCKKEYRCELSDKWSAENSDKFHYEVKEEK